MILSLTRITLKNYFNIIPLLGHSSRIINQLRHTDGCKLLKTRGFGKDWYTMTLWEDELKLMRFLKSGAHAEAMKDTAKLASSVVSKRIETDTVPTWKEAKNILKPA